MSHWQFTSWPDYGVPASAMAMLNFLQRVREQQANMVKELGDTWAGHPRGPPIVVHCKFIFFYFRHLFKKTDLFFFK